MNEYIRVQDAVEHLTKVFYALYGAFYPRVVIDEVAKKALSEVTTSEAIYLCNRKKCDRCNPECDFTRDIDYAAATDKVIIIDGAAYAVKGKPKGRWIPVTEWLPEKGEECIVTYDAEIVGTNVYPVSEKIYPEFVSWDGTKWTNGDCLSIGVNVIAWVPLPEPYKEADQ